MQSQHPNIVFESDVPFTSSRIQAAAIYCSDGRFGEQMDDFLHNGLHLPRYDRLALPGGAACLAGHIGSFYGENALAEELKFLVAVHQLRRVVLIAHSDCAYYTQRLRLPALGLQESQSQDLLSAAKRIRGIDRNLAVQAFFARRCEDRIRFEEVAAA